MANRIRCSKSTYDKYLSGKLTPKAINNIMNLLSMLTDEDLLRTVEQWRKSSECNNKAINKENNK